MDPVTASLIAGGVSGAGQVAQGLGAKARNRENRQFQREMLEEQKQMIAAQNVYNSPLAQMNRFKEAGLNPHLIYGKGTPGNQTQTAKPGDYDAKNIFQSMGQGGVVKNAMNAAVQQTQMRNIEADTLLKASQNLDVLAKTKNMNWKNKLQEKTFDWQVQAQLERLNTLREGTKQSRIKTEILDETKQSKINSAVADLDIKTAILQGKNLDNLYKAYVARLAENNINVNDPAWTRQVQLWFERAVETYEENIGKYQFHRYR